MIRDLLFFYGKDLYVEIHNDGVTMLPPRLVLVLIEGLPDTSYTHAVSSGGMEWMGWGKDRQIMADLYDAVNTNTYMTGMYRKRPKEPVKWPRPWDKKSRKTKAEKGRKATVKDVFARLGVGAGRH